MRRRSEEIVPYQYEKRVLLLVFQEPLGACEFIWSVFLEEKGGGLPPIVLALVYKEVPPPFTMFFYFIL